MSDDVKLPARRFLHLCYCTDDGDAVVDFLTAGLGLRKTMETPLEASDGGLFNMDREITSAAAFVFDGRGPRRAPAVEVQTWAAPNVVGSPPVDPTAAGIQALGYAVADLDAAVSRLLALGCVEVGRGTGPSGGPTVVVRDPEGVTLDVEERAGIVDASHLVHVRISVTDLEVSLPWYENIGWQIVHRGPLADAGLFGLPGAAEADVVRLRLPDEATETHLIEWKAPATHGRHPSEAYHAGIYRIAVGVDDTRASHAALAADGVAFDKAPLSMELKGTTVPDMWICFLRDPDGVPYEFVQRPRSAFRA